MVKKINSKLNLKLFLALHASLLFSSLGGVASKMAANEEMFSLSFFIWYGLVLFIMFGYALIWQQILKHVPLTVAFSNKPVGLVWGMVWGTLFFQEVITWKMILGAAIIFVGIYLVVTGDE